MSHTGRMSQHYWLARETAFIACLLALLCHTAVAQEDDRYAVAFVWGDGVIMPVARFEGGAWRNVSGLPGFAEGSEAPSLTPQDERVPAVSSAYEKRVGRWHYRSKGGDACVVEAGDVVEDELDPMTLRLGFESDLCLNEKHGRPGIALSRDYPMAAMQQHTKDDADFAVPLPLRDLVATAIAQQEREAVASRQKGGETDWGIALLPASPHARDVQEVEVLAFERSEHRLGEKRFYHVRVSKEYPSEQDPAQCGYASFLDVWIVEEEGRYRLLGIGDFFVGSCYENKGETSVTQHGLFQAEGSVFAVVEIEYWEGSCFTVMELTKAGAKQALDRPCP